MAFAVSDPVPPTSGAPDSARQPLRQLVAAGDLRLVLQFADAREYTDQIGALTRVPGAPAWLLGVYASEGAAVPLVDLAAWAQRSEPAPWKAWREDDVQAATPFATSQKGMLHALRFGEGTDAWAIRMSQSPSVFDPNRHAAMPFSNRLPLHVSAVHGGLMVHAEQIWQLAPGSMALQVRWKNVHAALLQDLSGASAAGAA